MNNYRFKLLIRPDEIYDRLAQEQKELFGRIEIVKSELLPDGDVAIECLALEDEIVECDYFQVMTFKEDEHITAVGI